MYQMVKKVCSDNETSWSAIPAFQNTFNAFTEKLGLLEDYIVDQTQALTGVKAFKEQKRKEVANKALSIASALVALANEINDVEMVQKMRITPTQLENGTGLKSLLLIDRIIDKAQLHIDDLINFGIAPEDLAELEAMRLELSNALTAPRQAIIARKHLTVSIKEKVSEIDQLLKLGLDRLARVVKSTDEAFFRNYHNARIIVDYKGRGTQSDIIDIGLDTDNPDNDDGFGTGLDPGIDIIGR